MFHETFSSFAPPTSGFQRLHVANQPPKLSFVLPSTVSVMFRPPAFMPGGVKDLGASWNGFALAQF